MTRTKDVIIVGAGMAGLVCAYECVQAGLSVTLIHQGLIDHTSSSYAQGGIAAVWHEDDSFERHIEDTLIAGDGFM